MRRPDMTGISCGFRCCICSMVLAKNEGSWVWQGRIGWMMDNFLSEKKVTPMLIVMADGMMSEDGDPEKKNYSVAVHEISDAGSDAVYRGALPRTDGTGKLRDRRAFDGVDAGGHGSVFLSGKNLPDRAFFRLSAQLYRRGGNCGQPFDAGVCGRRGVQSEYEALYSARWGGGFFLFLGFGGGHGLCGDYLLQRGRKALRTRQGSVEEVRGRVSLFLVAVTAIK